MNDNMLSTKEVAEKLKVTTRTVINWINGGTIPAVKIGGTYRVSENVINDLLGSLTNKK